MNDDDDMLNRLRAALHRPVPPVDAERVEAVRAAAVDAASAGTVTPLPRRPTRRALVLGAAAASVAAVGGAVAGRATDNESDPVAGPPTHPLAWSSGDAAVAGATVDGVTINHTWGVELLLDATGFPVGAPYRVVYVTTTGETVDAGGFVGAELPIHCRCNGAALRDAVAAIEIRDASDAAVNRAVFV